MSTLRYKSDPAYWERWFPADFISESFPGQFRNWFYSLLAMSTILVRRAPFKNVFTYATLLAEDGRAMHKSWGNMIEFNEAADEMGVDVMRWLFCNHKPEKDLIFGYQRANEARRQFLLPLHNVYAFLVTYANIDGWSPDDERTITLSPLDRWIRARLQETIQEVTNDLELYDPQRATERLGKFLDDLSNWYLRRSRRRFWAKAGQDEASDQDKHAAYATLYEMLVMLTRLLAPFTPFLVETMHQNLVRQVDPQADESVHHTRWPEVTADEMDAELIAEMALIQKLVSLGHAARNQANRKLRQPLAEAAFAVSTHAERAVVEAYQDLLADELNVKNVRLLDTATEAVHYALKALPKQLGQKYGSRFPKIRAAVASLDPAASATALLQGEALTVEVEGDRLELLPDEIEVRVEAQAGFSAAAEGGYLAALVTDLTDDLELEGMAREVVRRVQDLRKQAGYNVDDLIKIIYHASPRLAQAVDQFSNYIMGETLAAELTENLDVSGDEVGDYEFEGERLSIGVGRA
jgi:isoleucyl-tRNA synthetase